MKDLKMTALSALEALRREGACTAAVSVEYTETREFNVDGGEFSLLRTLFDDSLAMTALKEGKKGSIAINHLDDASVAEAAKACLSSAEAAEPDECWEIAPGAGAHSFTEGAVEPDLDKLFDRCRELMEDIGRDHPSILMEQMIVSHVKSSRVYANTHGSCFTELSGAYSIMLMFSAHKGEQSSSFFGSSVTTASLDRPFIELGSIRRDLTDVEKQIAPQPVTGKFEGTVVLTPSCFGEMLFYTLDNFAGGPAILDRTSLWKDKLGEKVADPRLTVSLAPGHKDVVCGDKWTGDGWLAEDFDIIRDGRLTGFMLNQYYANKTGQKRAPNTSMNLVVAAGEKPLSELLAGIGRGLLVSRISGGEPSASGDFSMVAKNSFLIENGQVGPAVSEVMLNGNLAGMLLSLRGLSAERECDGSASLPWAAFDGMTISGK